MRIAMLAWDVEGNAGSTPVGIHVALLARHLSQQGHHVDLFCPPLLDGDALLVSKTPNLSIIPVPIPKSSTDFLADNAQFCSTLQDICDAHADGNSYDIIHVHDWLPCRAAVALRQQWATPLVLTLHSTEPARVGTPELNSDQQ